MFASLSKTDFAYNLIVGIIEAEVKKRQYISLPSDEAIIKSLKEIIEEDLSVV